MFELEGTRITDGLYALSSPAWSNLRLDPVGGSESSSAMALAYGGGPENLAFRLGVLGFMVEATKLLMRV